jgi:hypothetical protein
MVPMGRAESPPRRKTLWRGIVAIGLALVVALAVWGGYVWGERTPHVSVLTGDAYYSGYQAEATVNGWSYDIPLNVAWVGADGDWNQSGRRHVSESAAIR